jgi:hypothetical protein
MDDLSTRLLVGGIGVSVAAAALTPWVTAAVLRLAAGNLVLHLVLAGAGFALGSALFAGRRTGGAR